MEVSELSEGQAAGIYGIPTELLKAVGVYMTWWQPPIMVQVLSPMTGEKA